MRKKSTLKILLVIFISAFSFAANSQVYFGVYSGYGLPIAKRVIATDVFPNSSGTVLSTMVGSFGKGFTNGLLTGYQFNNYLSAELGIEQLSGSKILYSLVDSSDFYAHTIERMAKAKMINLIPAIRLTVGEGKFKSYIRTGMLIGFNGEIVSDKSDISEARNYTDRYETTEQFRGGIAFGFLSGLGLSYSLNNALSFSAEAVVHAQTWSPQKSSIIKCTRNGVDELPSFPTYAKEFEYAETAPGYWLQPSPDSPTIRLREYYSFSSYGLSLGVRYKF